MFEVAIAWLISSAPTLGAIATAIEFGREVGTASSLLIKKEFDKLTATEKRFVEISPLAVLVQRKVATRLIAVFVISLACAGIILLASLVYKDSLPVRGLPAFAALLAIFLGLNSPGLFASLKDRLVGADERKILREYGECYRLYVKEKIEQLKILTEREHQVFKLLSLSDLKKDVSYKTLENEILKSAIVKNDRGNNKKDIKRILKKLVTFGYIKVERNALMMRKYSVGTGSEAERQQ